MTARPDKVAKLVDGLRELATEAEMMADTVADLGSDAEMMGLADIATELQKHEGEVRELVGFCEECDS